MNKFDFAYLIGIRALHLEEGADPLVDYTNITCACQLALKEFKTGKLDFYVVTRD